MKRLSGKQSLSVDGHQRTFILDIPNHISQTTGLILVSHGFGDSAESIRNYSGFKDTFEKHDFVFAFLEGTKDKAGKPNFQVEYEFQDKSVDDVRFASAVVHKLITDLHLDPNSVFATGMSNGADFCYYLARQEKPIVRAIAPVAGTMMTCWRSLEFTHRPFAIMEVHGTSDSITRWNGDMDNHDHWGAYLGTPSVMDFWIKALSLEKATTKELRPSHPTKQDNIILNHWATTHDSSELLLYILGSGEHVWPTHLADPKKTTAEEILAFFESHRTTK